MPTHKAVLLHEAIDSLHLTGADTVLDGTIGAGGHARHIANQLTAAGTLIGMDMDPAALEQTRTALANVSCRVMLRTSNYRHLDTVLANAGILQLDAALFDLGMRSDQIDAGGRGFSFQRDEPLLMTYSADPSAHMFTARDIVNEWDQENIADVIYGYGGERYARRIAEQIVQQRQNHPIETTAQLVDSIYAATPRRYHRSSIHPATRTFQALRIVVNDEIEGLKTALSVLHEYLAPGGRVAVITFHSIEERAVKHTFRSWAHAGYGEVQTKKPVEPSDAEVAENPRARSAKLRVYQKNKHYD
jgi:16S rRNA (cytosine1402-N4)-methyltransferase